MTRYVAGLIFDPDFLAVALVRKARPDWQAGLLNAIGGHIEASENPLQAMQREAHEEAGVPEDLVWAPTVRLYGAGRDYVVHFFTATSAEIYTVATLTDEPIEVHPLRGIAERADLMPNLRYILPLSINEETRPGSRIRLPIELTEELCEQPRVSVFI